MKRITRDFITLFNVFWYRDFPLSERHKTQGSRAEWTTHIGICVRSCADLLGYFTYFEQGNRTDAIIKNNKDDHVARIEWEWYQPFREDVNEIDKLYEARKAAEFSAFVSYSRLDHHEKNIEAIRRRWRRSDEPLLVFLVTFTLEGNSRVFQNLETYLFQKEGVRLVRSQPALPWEAIGTRWEVLG